MGYKFSTIKNVLTRVISSWLETLPMEIRGQVAKDTMVCGGAITSMMLGETPNDYDIYFKTKATALLVAKHYCSQAESVLNRKATVLETVVNDINGCPEERIQIFIKSTGVAGQVDDESEELAENLKVSSGRSDYSLRYITDNAISLAQKTQLIIRFWGEPEEIFKNYDFVHCMASFDFVKQVLLISPDTMQSVLSKTLVYKGSKYPVASILRLRKFLARGWRISAGQTLKIIMQLRNWDMTDPTQLREQLIGVDFYYMRGLLDALASKGDERIDQQYMVELLDSIFKDM